MIGYEMLDHKFGNKIMGNLDKNDLQKFYLIKNSDLKNWISSQCVTNHLTAKKFLYFPNLIIPFTILPRLFMNNWIILKFIILINV